MLTVYNMDIDRDYILKVAWHYVGNKADAEDIAQEAMLKAHTSQDTFQAKSQATSWVFMIVKNAAMDFLRKRAKQSRDLTGAVPTYTPNPAGHSDAKHDLVVAVAAVDAMGPKSSEAFKLRYLQEYTEGEVAEMLGIPINTAKARANRARRVAAEALSA